MSLYGKGGVEPDLTTALNTDFDDGSKASPRSSLLMSSLPVRKGASQHSMNGGLGSSSSAPGVQRLTDQSGTSGLADLKSSGDFRSNKAVLAEI